MTVSSTAGQLPDTVKELLIYGAQTWPDRDFVLFPDGAQWTRARAFLEARRAATSLTAQGVAPGCRVVVMLENGPDWLRAWWALALLGATIVPINPNFQGRILDDLLERIQPSHIIRGSATGASTDDGRLIRPEALNLPDARHDAADHPVASEDTHAIVFTSGTTGPSKGSVTSNMHVCRQSRWLIEGADVDEKDRLLADLPLYHLAAMGGIALMMAVGGSVALRTKPSLTNYWAVVAQTGVTFAYLVGSMAAKLLGNTPEPAEREHRLRFMLASPLPSQIEEFSARFLAGLVTGFGSTETSTAIRQTLHEPVRPGSCGRERPGFDVRLLDADGHEAAPGTLGELVVRSTPREMMSLGYFADEAATAQAWRDGWFHTGDIFVRDDSGYFYWKDRAKDSIRRRGENVSSFEVEREVASHPLIAEAACIAVPGDLGGDEEIKVFVVCAGENRPDWIELVNYLASRMPYFMVPRYFEIVDHLPKTPTLKVQKFPLRNRPHASDCWDRSAAGLEIGRNGKVTRNDTVKASA